MAERRIAGPGGSIILKPASETTWRVIADPAPGVFVPIPETETRYPPELVEKIVKTKGVAYACDDISREEEPSYTNRMLGRDLLAYVEPAELAGKRILDFGCGSGASTMFLARTFPKSEITGIELVKEFLEIAEGRLAHYGYPNVRFQLSPSGNEVARDLGRFDLIIFSAVFEHLMPDERLSLMPQIWNLLAPGGRLFINQTPHRFFPLEGHTTGLPLLNYLPKSLAGPVARTFSKRNLENDDWNVLLRKGIRGATEAEIVRALGPGANASIEKPIQYGGSRLNLWYSYLSPRMRPVKVALRETLRVISAVTGSLVTPNVTLVLRKP